MHMARVHNSVRAHLPHHLEDYCTCGCTILRHHAQRDMSPDHDARHTVGTFSVHNPYVRCAPNLPRAVQSALLHYMSAVQIYWHAKYICTFPPTVGITAYSSDAGIPPAAQDGLVAPVQAARCTIGSDVISHKCALHSVQFYSYDKPVHSPLVTSRIQKLWNVYYKWTF